MRLLQSLCSLVHAGLSSQDTIWALDRHHDGFSASCVAHSPSSFTRSHGLSNSRDLLVSDGHRDGPRVSAQTPLVGSPRCCRNNCTYGRDESFEYRERRGRVIRSSHSFRVLRAIERVFGSSQARCGVASANCCGRGNRSQSRRCGVMEIPLAVCDVAASQVFAVLRDGSTVPCFVIHQGSERHCVRCDGCCGCRPPDSGAAQTWTRTTKAASHTPSLFSL